MFGTIKKAMVLAAIAGVGVAAAPAVASAGPVFDTSATGTPGEAAHGTGQLTLTVVVLGAPRTTTCDVTVTADLWNAFDAGTVRGLGEVTTFLLGAPAGGSCTTSIPGCTVTATANTSTPWGITTDTPADVTISGINFTNVYSGVSCPLNGVSLNATGSLTGSVVSDGVLEFDEAEGLSTPFGDATVSGEVNLDWEIRGTPVKLS